MSSGNIKVKNEKTILLVGKAEARFLTPSKKDQTEKHLYSYGCQLYSYWPYQG